MMIDDTENISKRTWSRNIEPVSKIGYMDGAADGQDAAFQSSFDLGYKQGFSFGLQLGSNHAITSFQENSSSDLLKSIQDPRKINCQLCLSGIPSEQNVLNLYNSQQEKINELIKEKECTVKMDYNL